MAKTKKIEGSKIEGGEVTLRFPYLTHRTNQFRKLKYSQFWYNFDGYIRESAGDKVNIDDKYRELAGILGEDVWIFQGYHPTKQPPELVAEKLAQIIFPNDKKKRERLRTEATEFFGSVKAIDLVNGMVEGVDRSFESVLTLIRENAGLSKRRAGIITGFGRMSFYRWENENNKSNQGVDKAEKICQICLISGPQKDAVINKYWEQNDKTSLVQILSAKSTSEYITGLLNLAHFPSDKRAADEIGVSRRTILAWKSGEQVPEYKESKNILALLVRKLEKKYPVIDGTSHRFLKNVNLPEEQQARYWGDIIFELRRQVDNMDRAEMLTGIRSDLGEDFGGKKKFGMKALAAYENGTLKDNKALRPAIARAILNFFEGHEDDSRVKDKEKYTDLQKELKEKFDEIGVFSSPKIKDSKKFYKKIINDVQSGNSVVEKQNFVSFQRVGRG